MLLLTLVVCVKNSPERKAKGIRNKPFFLNVKHVYEYCVCLFPLREGRRERMESSKAHLGLTVVQNVFL